MLLSDDRLRRMYAGGRGNPAARRFSRLWSAVFRLGLLPRRWVSLEVAGRRTGRVRRFPLGMADWRGEWYLVSMLGERCDWVRNVRAAGGRATIRHRRSVACELVEVPVAERAPILRRYLDKVPGARPHLPVRRHAPLAEFEAVAARYPVFRVARSSGAGAGVSGAGERGERRRRHWWRWIVGTVVGLVVLVVLAGVLSVKLASTPAPLGLWPVGASVPAGSIDGTWQVGAGSVAGFRIQQTVMFATGEVVDRTSAVTGTVVISGDQVTSATFGIDLTTLTAGGKQQPQVAISLDTQRFPRATFTLTRPMTLGPAVASGATGTATATGQLSLRGNTRQVTFAVSGRRTGADLQVVGSIPIAFADWGITGPTGYGPLASLADHANTEFSLILHRN